MRYLIVCTLLAAVTAGEQDTTLTLEKLFPEKSFFGPSARSMALSADGRYGAYLWRPYAERRHGSDLWILDTRSGTTRRVTKVSVLAEFQEEVRKVREDRIRKAKKARAEKKGSEENAGEAKRKPEDEEELGDTVDEKDADDDKAPRYDGIQSFSWAPRGHDLLFSSGGDGYRYDIEKNVISRLTRTRDRERGLKFLPDGHGYTYLRDKALMRVVFGSHIVEQLDPELPGGEEMIDYTVSPDGNALAFIARKSDKEKESPRKVGIVDYRDRFARVKEIPRQVSDDPRPPTEYGVYLYGLTDSLREKNTLTRVFSDTESGPRDILSEPRWAPDSSRATFAIYRQASADVRIFEARFPPEDTKDEPPADGGEKKGEPPAGADEKKDEEKIATHEAKLVYRFLHHGGPTTPYMVRPEYIHDSRHILLLTEQSGFRHLYLLDPLYEALDPLTAGRYEVYPIALSRDRRRVFFTSTEADPARRGIYAMDLADRTATALTTTKGVYDNVAVSDDARHVLANFVSYGRLTELVYVQVPEGKEVTLTDSHPKQARELTRPRPAFFTYRNRHGHVIHGQMFKPDDWKPADKRPLLIYVYGGPLGDRKMVADGSYGSDSYFFAYYLAKKHGYVTCTIDPRGMSGYGGLFEKSNFEKVGRPQVEDLVDGVRWLVARHGIDPKRVGIHGWSFGGFQTQMCLYTEPDVFACGIAGAGPTEWENYNAWYSTGTVGTSRTGETDLAKYSLLPLAKNLKAKLLLVHGMEDPNVLYQDTVRVYRELLKSGKETLVELFLDPTGSHGLGGDVKKLGRYRKYEEFLLRTLGTEAAVPPPPKPAETF